MPSLLQHSSTHYSFNSETFRDRLKPRASDTASPRAVTTHQDRPPPQQAGPPQHALVVKKKSVDDSRKPGRIVRSVSTAMCAMCAVSTAVCAMCTVCTAKVNFVCTPFYV